MKYSELCDLLQQAGFVKDPPDPRHCEAWRHRDGRWATVTLNADAGERCGTTGFAISEVRCVRLHPADGGYPKEYRQHFAPILRELKKVLS